MNVPLSDALTKASEAAGRVTAKAVDAVTDAKAAGGAAKSVAERARRAVKAAAGAETAKEAGRKAAQELGVIEKEVDYLFKEVPSSLSTSGVLAVAAVLGFTGAPLPAWAGAGATALYGFGVRSRSVWGLYLGLVALFHAKPLRKQLSKGVMQAMEALQFLPEISETEQVAIEAGNVWMDAELFSGKPDLDRLNSQPYGDISERERAFLDGPAQEVCEMSNEWEIMQRGDLSEETWDFLRKEKFFGMIVPEEYGGLGFSAKANSMVVKKLGTCSLPLSITVMVPNSLGPAELLIHYGTDEQKDYYLPRLAKGEIIPSFALTEPNAGSDAGAMESTGEVFKDNDGEIKIRLNWTKRYISLAAISDILGLAFNLRDPENLLGQGEDLGITCALVPTDLDGIELGKRHDPLGIPFYNCPTKGHDVVVPLDAIIGGEEGAGEGWKMLMNCLGAGRGISLPAQGTGAGQYVTRVAGAHAAIRQQFGLSIGKFEGIEEPLARIAGYTYLADASRNYTVGGLDKGERPAVVSAIMKYNLTELQREIVNDGMDILAGSGISRGPSNLLAPAYQGLPISITVEGANILTRTMMIFGQGAIRCHPYALEEIEALMDGDVDRFDAAFWPHIGHVVRNAFRSVGMSLTRGRLARSPVGGPAAPYWKKLAWSSATFAILADLAMGSLGGALKRKEKLTGRFADVLSWMYIGAATLRRFEAEGRQKEHEPYMHWAMQECLRRIQVAFDGLFENLEVPGLTWFFRYVAAPWSRLNTLGEGPSDALGGEIAAGIQTAGGAREWLTDGVYEPDRDDHPLAQQERAFQLSRKEYHIGQKVKAAIKRGDLPKKRLNKLVDEAVEQGVITEEERETVRRADAEREEYVKVDAFDLGEYRKGLTVPGANVPDEDLAPTAPNVENGETGGDGATGQQHASGDGTAEGEPSKPDPEQV
ncbi:MAG: acyl-CoA dehydrogenase [Bacteroidetes bacterium QS_9_68_14]|nr:MAG: acyl-CoA dehydrogenase [Bacteroidetes bacterium QS_9_68_14]